MRLSTRPRPRPAAAALWNAVSDRCSSRARLPLPAPPPLIGPPRAQECERPFKGARGARRPQSTRQRRLVPYSAPLPAPRRRRAPRIVLASSGSRPPALPAGKCWCGSYCPGAPVPSRRAEPRGSSVTFPFVAVPRLVGGRCSPWGQPLLSSSSSWRSAARKPNARQVRASGPGSAGARLGWVRGDPAQRTKNFKQSCSSLWNFGVEFLPAFRSRSSREHLAHLMRGRGEGGPRRGLPPRSFCGWLPREPRGALCLCCFSSVRSSWGVRTPLLRCRSAATRRSCASWLLHKNVRGVPHAAPGGTAVPWELLPVLCVPCNARIARQCVEQP